MYLFHVLQVMQGYNISCNMRYSSSILSMFLSSKWCKDIISPAICDPSPKDPKYVSVLQVMQGYNISCNMRFFS